MASDLPAGFRAVTLPPGFYEASEPKASPPPKNTAPPEGEGIIAGAIKDTLGLGRPTAKTPLGVLLKPQGALEHAASMAVQIPAVAATGGGAAAVGVPAAVGRIAASGALSAAERMARGGEAFSWDTALDTVVAAITEGAAGLAGKALKGAGAAARGYEWATGAPAQALDAIQSRLPMGKWINAPSLSRGRLTAREAVDKLAKTTGDLYSQARREIADEFRRLDIQRLTGPKPTAGQLFKDRTAPDRFPASGLSELAEKARRVMGSNVPRAALDVAATEREPTTGVPFGALAAVAAKDLAKQAPVVGPALRFIDRE